MSSSNDLATALALYAKDIPITLSEYIHDQGIDMTIYDPSGYDFGDSTKVSKGYARDVLVSAYEILKTHPDIARATTQQQYILDTISLSHTYPNIENITNIRFAKTGYTSLAGGNMMAIIEPDPGVFIGIVVMNAGFDSRFTDFEAVVESVQQAYYIIR